MLEKLFEGKSVERVPVAPLITLGHAARLIGASSYEYIFNPQIYARAQIYAKRYYGYDWVFAHQVFQGLIEKEKKTAKKQGNAITFRIEIGTKFRIPEKGMPHIIERPIKSSSAEEAIEELERLEIPELGSRERMLPIKLMLEKESFVSGNMRCPFTFASEYLYDIENFLINMKINKNFIRKLVDFAYEYTLEAVKAQIRAGVDAIFLEDPNASPNLISPDDAREFALPYAKKLISKIRSEVPVILHICGNVTNILKDIASANAHAVSVDESVSMEDVLKLKKIAWGNIKPYLLVKGSINEVRLACEKIVKLRKSFGDGIVLSSGCVVPKNAEEDNIKEMVRVAKQGKKHEEGN